MTQNRKGLLLVISGPAGVGKGTINISLISRNSDIRMSVSATRARRVPAKSTAFITSSKPKKSFKR